MKKLLLSSFVIGFILSLFLVWGASSSYAAEELPWDIKLPFKSAIIQYEITGMETGHETLYIKDHGKYRALHHDGTSSIFGITAKNRRIEITDPDWHYTFDLEKQTGSKITNPRKFYLDEYNKLSSEEKKNVQKNAQELGVSLMRDMNAKTVEKATTVLGYECDQTTIMGGITLTVMHKTDVPLLTEMNLAMMSSKTQATGIDETNPPQSAFALPEGISVVHDMQSEAMARQMAVNYISTLKEPDGAEKMRSSMSAEDSEGYVEEPVVDEGNEMRDEETPPSPDQNELEKNMQEGMKLLKGLFGN